MIRSPQLNYSLLYNHNSGLILQQLFEFHYVLDCTTMQDQCIKVCPPQGLAVETNKGKKNMSTQIIL